MLGTNVSSIFIIVLEKASNHSSISHSERLFCISGVDSGTYYKWKITYSIAELSDFITDTVDTYVAKAGEGTVAIREFAVEDGIAHVYLDYAGAEDYAEFNGVEFYAGTVLDAKANGYDIPDAFTAVTDTETTWDAEGNKIVIVGQQTQVQVDGTILFVSANASATGKNTADVTYDILDEEAQPAYIIYK